jgi:hypothetical protein
MNQATTPNRGGGVEAASPLMCTQSGALEKNSHLASTNVFFNKGWEYSTALGA